VASAWATLISRFALLALVVWVILAWPEARRLGVRAKPPHDPAASVQLRRIGYAASLSYFVETAAFASMSIVAGWFGAVSVATWAIVLNVAAIIFMGPLGLATATGVFVGRAFGAGDRAGVRRAGLLGFGATLGLTLVICAVVALGNEAIASAYTREPAVQAMTAAALLLSCLFFVADGLQVVGAQALRAQNDIWVPAATHFFSYIAVMIPCAYVFAVTMGGGVTGIVWAVIVASLISAGLLLGRFAWMVRRHKAVAAA
jgi:MATE family multidrug resistance protein